MSKTLGYYTNYSIGDGSLLDEMEKSWGGFFSELTQSEKLWILASIAGVITAEKSPYYDPNNVSDDIVPACERLQELSFQDQLGLAIFLIENLT